MKRIGARRLAPLILAAALASPAGLALAAKSTTHVYKGVSVNSQYGPIQVAITVKSRRIVDVKVVASTHTTRSSLIENNATPVLKQEVLQAQSARINTVSGATSFSQGYIQSLQSAVKKAGL